MASFGRKSSRRPTGIRPAIARCSPSCSASPSPVTALVSTRRLVRRRFPSGPRMPGRDGERSGTGVSLERHLKAAFTERLGYKAAALFFAVVLWLVVSAEEPSEELVPVRLEASFDTTRVLTSPRPAVRALVAGRARDLIKLYDTPPVVRRLITDDAPDSVAVDLRPADVYIPPDVDAIVRDIQPRNLVLVF